jgi:hypothetical protein
MVRNGPTKRWSSYISARFGLSACILLPPLLVAAGVAFFDSFAPQGDGPQLAAEPTPAPESIIAKTVSSAGPSDAGSSFALANAEVHSVISEKLAVAGQRPERGAGSTQNAAGGQAAATNDPARYYGPVPVALVRVRKGGEPPEMADLEATAPTIAPAKISQRLPATTRSFAAFHARGTIGRHKPHAAHPIKRQHSAALSHKAPRPSLRQHTQRR